MLAHPDVALSGHAHKILPTPAMPSWDLGIAGRELKAKYITKLGMLLFNQFTTPSVMLKRDIQQRFVERQRYMEDHMLWLNIVCSGAVVKTLLVPLAAIYKRPYGQAGLSAQWWLMERGDLGNYRRLLAKKYLTRIQFLALALFSGAKFLRRLMIYSLFAPRVK
jgi:hypothetical protein